MIRAEITSGTQPKVVRIKTMSIDPQPLSRTASGGKMIDSKTRQKLIIFIKGLKNEFK
jgi:hypothetical protein